MGFFPFILTVYLVFVSFNQRLLNFAFGGTDKCYLESPAPLSVEGEYAVATYSNDTFGHSGIVRIRLDESNQTLISAEITNGEYPLYTVHDDLRALSIAEEVMYFNPDIVGYAIYEDCLAPH